MHKKLTLSLLLLVVTCTLFAQEIPVTIRLLTSRKDPVTLATVSIRKRSDSLAVLNRVTDSTGQIMVSLVPNEQYVIRASSVNFQPLEKGITISTDHHFFSFEMEAAAKTLQTAVVVARKPVIKQEDDKTIVDPEALADASTSGYEVIEKTPGLFVDQDGNIYISSLTPATVQINGREMKMSASDMATLLKSLPPNAIARIEIVRTPSARYDASSSGGVVNVVLKKGVKLGTTGSINGGFQQGRYGNQFLGFNLNKNDGEKSSFINLNVANRNSYEDIITNRLFAADTILAQDAHTVYPTPTYFAGYGHTWPGKGKWDYDFGTSASLNDFNNKSQNRNTIQKISTGQPITDFMNLVNNDGRSFNFRAGLEGTKKLDSTGSQWDNDIFYNYTSNTSNQVFSTYNLNPYSLVTGGDGNSDNKRNLITLQSDLKLKLKHRFIFEGGLKTSLLYYNSATEYFKAVSGQREKDASRTSTFHYNENINAAYVQGSKTFGKDAILKFGTRLENTNMNGHQLVPFDTTFSIHRTDLFPYVYLSKNLMNIMGYSLRAYLVYRRTITRPFYEQLNPFPRYVDQFLTEVGNPSLRPQFTQNYEANISVDERPILAVGVNDTRDIFTSVVYKADTSSSQAYRTYDNLGRNKEWYLRGLGALPPGGVYFFVLGAQYNHNFYQGLYQGQPLSFRKGTWTLFTYHSLKIGRLSQATLNGFVRFRGQQQFYELSTFGALNASINRKFLKEKLIITATVSDIFASNRNDFNIHQATINAFGTRKADTRRFGINIRYNFGIRKKEDNNPAIPSIDPS